VKERKAAVAMASAKRRSPEDFGGGGVFGRRSVAVSFMGDISFFVAEGTVNHMREGGKKDGDGKETERN
jgi:hypothetical protein